MDTGLAGQTVIVTGANANIGRAICLGFAAEGAKLVVVGRDAAQGERVVHQAFGRGADDALWAKCDVTDRR
jgi:2-hydroxycyclohexanecarboxyl-CoA dehydrogenase